MADPAFPNLPNATTFPGIDNVNVYRYENTFDYSRWGTDTVFKCLNVPWCSDYENVVDFGSETVRDTWFDSQSADVFSMNTMFHAKPTLSIKLPIPVGVLTRYNYLMVRLPTPTSDAAPIAYERTTNRTNRFFFFIMDAVQVAPSTTLAELQLDVWTTYRYSLIFDHIMLERGHIAVKSAATVDSFLFQARYKMDYLTDPDPSYGPDPAVYRTQTMTAINSPSPSGCWAVFMSDAGWGGAWGDINNPTVPAASSSMTQALLAPTCYAIGIADLEDFLADVDTTCPQLKATVRGVFFCDGELLTFREGNVTVAGHTLKFVDAMHTNQIVLTLNKDMFAYPAEAADFTKLYTWPYACVSVSDGNGNENIFKVEDTTSTVSVEYALSMVFGAVRIDGYVVNVGGTVVNTTYGQGNSTRNFKYGGMWNKLSLEWNVPVMSVELAGAIDAQWKSAYIRQHRQLAATNALANATATATTAQANAWASAAGAETNTNTLNAAQTTITANSTATAKNIQQDAATKSNNVLERLNQSITTMTDIDNAWQAALSGLTTDTQGITTGVNIGTSLTVGMVSTVTGAGAGFAAGGPAGAVIGALVPATSAVAGAIDSGISSTLAISNNESVTVGLQTVNHLRAAEKILVNNYNNEQNQLHILYQVDQNNTCATNNTAAAVNASNAAAANTHDIQHGNAVRNYDTATANANRDYATATDAIAKQLAQDSAVPPAVYGTNSALTYAATRPQAVYANVLTQTDGAIMAAAATFARYGYTCHREFEVNDTLQIMNHFTYWKCENLWLQGSGSAIESAQRQIKDIMLNGITVWSDPDDIGNVGIFENM